ncbi:DUF1127 domain-containing protein [uncultured Shimia sp.]|uniref:DUF1127 domain-containing protein n=1 Tax=uncultured Shimia sp. TaxID=573152 RepID=UPI0026311894|nr:DUF1127 domain-containing protein [uncultured Shimia sp.]
MAHATVNLAHFGFFDVIRNTFADLRAAAAERSAYQRTYNELSRLTDRELSDIGLRRCDIAEVCAKSARG